jgi:hypothetical protein
MAWRGFVWFVLARAHDRPYRAFDHGSPAPWCFPADRVCDLVQHDPMRIRPERWLLTIVACTVHFAGNGCGNKSSGSSHDAASPLDLPVTSGGGATGGVLGVGGNGGTGSGGSGVPGATGGAVMTGGATASGGISTGGAPGPGTTIATGGTTGSGAGGRSVGTSGTGGVGSGGTSGGGGVTGSLCPGFAQWPSGTALCRVIGECPSGYTDCYFPSQIPDNCTDDYTRPPSDCQVDGDCGSGKVCEKTIGCGGTGQTCTPACTPGSCAADETCTNSGHCEAISCTAGYTCPSYASCDPTSHFGLVADRHGCLAVSCEGMPCPANKVCRDSGTGTYVVCFDKSCSTDSDCDCGFCVGRSCQGRLAVCTNLYHNGGAAGGGLGGTGGMDGSIAIDGS